MNEGIFIPKQPAYRDSKPGFTPWFWTKYWDEEKLVTQASYNEAKKSLKTQVDDLIKTSSQPHLYAEIALKKEATSKSMKPSHLWEEADLEFVESKEDGTTLTLSGTKAAFRKLEKVLNEASYTSAMTGKDSDGEKLTGKTRDTYREIYAVASIQSSSPGVDKAVEDFLNSNSPDSMECIIELRSDVDSFEYTNIHNQLNAVVKDKVGIKDPDLFFSNMWYPATLTVSEINTLLSSEEFGFIRKIKRKPVYEIQRSPSKTPIDPSSISQPLTKLTMAIVDSGVKNTILSPLRAHHIKNTSLPSNPEHGTFVASRAIFGHDLTLYANGKIKALEPISKFIDIQVTGDKLIDGKMVNTLDDPQDLIGAVKEVVRRHTDVKVFNISVAARWGFDWGFDPEEIDELTLTLDELSNQYDVLFIVSAGNHETHKILPYSDIFKSNGISYDTKIAPPADSINSLSVGAISYKVKPDSMTPEDYWPSPFTRQGPVRQNVLKPELVEEGGDYLSDDTLDDDERDERSANNFGVIGLTQTGVFARANGNSEAAPLVSHQALQIQEYIEDQLSDSLPVRGNYANLMRTILAHSTALTPQVSINDVDVQKAHGLGIPNFENIFSDNPDRITMLYCDELDLAQKVHKLRFKVPEFLLKTKSKFIMTLAYNPPVDANVKDEYNLVTLHPSLRVILPPTPDKNGKLKEKPVTINCNKDWRASRNERSTLWHYTSVLKRELHSDVLEVFIQLNANPKLEKKVTKSEKRKEKQAYAIALSIIDEEQSSKLKTEIASSNQFEFITRNKIEVTIG